MVFIDKDLLLKDIEGSVVFTVRAGYISPELRGARKIIDRIENAPTADVVEVVRCGKCKHGEVSIMSKSKDGEEEMACYCNAKNKVTDIEYYCACGERRDT